MKASLSAAALPAALNSIRRDHAAWHPQRQGAKAMLANGVFPLSGMNLGWFRGFILRDATLRAAPQDEVSDPHGEARGPELSR
jgi:hypothetical protein